MDTFFPTLLGKDVLVLVIEDEKVSRIALGMLLALNGYTTETVGSAEEAVALLAVGQMPQLAVVDLDLPGMSGAEFVDYLEQAAPYVRAVIVSATSEDNLRDRMARHHVPFLRKPINFNDLLHVLDGPLKPN